MRTWKAAFAYVLFAYFVFASAISLAVQHYSQAALSTAYSGTGYIGRTAATGARTATREIFNPQPALATTLILGIGEVVPDSSQGDIPSSAPKSHTDDFGEIMTRALER